MRKTILLCMIACVFSLTSLNAQVTPIVAPVTETGHAKEPRTKEPTTPNGPTTDVLITGNGIDYHGGPVMLTPHNVYFIWYGNWTGNTALTILPQFISGLNGSSYFNTNTLYANGSGQNIVNTVTMNTQVFDNYSQGTVLSDQGLQTVVSSKLTAHTLPTDTNGIYFVLTSQDVDQKGSLGEFCVQFCGFHNHATLNGADIKFSFVGNIARCPSACAASNLGIGPNGNAGADAMANVMAHEFNETVTDPDLNAWFDSTGQEVGDKCNFRFGPEFTTTNGAPADVTLGARNFLIQENWINSAGGFCGMSFTTPLIIGSSSSDGARSTFEKHGETGILLLTGNLSVPRSHHSVTLLKNLSLFVAGGTDNGTSWQIMDQNAQVLSSGLLQDSRAGHAATLLTNGNVFIAGGNVVPSTWEIRSPTGALVTSGFLTGSRTQGVSARTLQNGNIWVSGAGVGSGDACTWEIHNGSGGLVSSGSLNTCFAGGQVQVLTNGNVILLGGDNAPGTWEIHSQTGAFVSTGSLLTGFNSGANSVLLNNGNVFIFGGGTWEIRNSSGGFVSTGSLQSSRTGAGAVVLLSGNVFITGGDSAPGAWEIRSATGALVSQGSLFNTRGGGHTLTHF
jgi:hypothetical protein